MTITRENLSERFQLLNDKELLSLSQSGDLTDLAKEVAADELRRRGVDVPKPVVTEPHTADESGGGDPMQDDLVQGDTVQGDLVQIARFFTPIEAHMLQSRLQADGVLAVVADAQLVGNNPFLTLALGGVRVLVPESQFERACEIVSAIERGECALD